MKKAFDNFLFGLAFGLGFMIAAAVLRAIVSLLGGAHVPAF